jgi:hypothetical protein
MITLILRREVAERMRVALHGAGRREIGGSPDGGAYRSK